MKRKRYYTLERSTADIYALIDPRDGTPFYVGRTQVPLSVRLEQHIRDLTGNNPLKEDRITEILEARLRPSIKRLARVLAEEAYIHEREWWHALKAQGYDLAQKPYN